MATQRDVASPRRAGRGSAAPRVLVVDDEADIRELLELTLVRMGLDVDQADGVAEARALLARQESILSLFFLRR